MKKEKFLVKVTTTCKKELIEYCYNKEDILICEKKLIFKMLDHEKTCSTCLAIKEWNEEEKKRNAIHRVQTVARCGEILFEEAQGNISKENIRQLERSVVNMFSYHFKTCKKCNRIYKLERLNEKSIK